MSMSRRRPPIVHERPQQALAREAGGLGDPQRRRVPGLDPELDPLHAELGERVPAEQRAARARATPRPASLGAATQ